MKFRTVFIVLGVLLLFIGTALGVVYWQFVTLPHPNQSSHSQLIRWVVLRDLDEEDRETQLALVNRFANEAEEIFAQVSPGYEIPESYSKRMLANIDLLKQVWFEDRIDSYNKIEEGDVREKYLGTQIALMDQLGNIAYENAKILYPEKDTENLESISGEMLSDIDRWISNTPAEKKEETVQAIREATTFWLTTQDLSTQVMQARKELVIRIIAELEAGMNLQATTSVVSGDRGEILRANAMYLMEAWFHQLAEEHAKLEKKEQVKFVDAKIKQVTQWKLLEFLSGSPSEATSNSDKPKNGMAGMAQFAKVLTEWQDRADESMKPKLKDFTSRLQQRVFFAFMQGRL